MYNVLFTNKNVRSDVSFRNLNKEIDLKNMTRFKLKLQKKYELKCMESTLPNEKKLLS